MSVEMNEVLGRSRVIDLCTFSAPGAHQPRSHVERTVRWLIAVVRNIDETRVSSKHGLKAGLGLRKSHVEATAKTTAPGRVQNTLISVNGSSRCARNVLRDTVQELSF